MKEFSEFEVEKFGIFLLAYYFEKENEKEYENKPLREMVQEATKAWLQEEEKQKEELRRP